MINSVSTMHMITPRPHRCRTSPRRSEDPQLAAPAESLKNKLKAAYAWGLRRREVIKLDLADLGHNPHAPEFGDLGVAYVRWGKASKGSAPKRRSVLTVFPWSVKVLEQWVGSYRVLFETAARSDALWPSERSPRLDMGALGDRFASYRDALGLPPELTLHCLRHSYVTHLIEAGYDPLFVQQQVGHSYASTTALYTSVSSDFRTRTLRSASTPPTPADGQPVSAAAPATPRVGGGPRASSVSTVSAPPATARAPAPPAVIRASCQGSTQQPAPSVSAAARSLSTSGASVAAKRIWPMTPTSAGAAC
ncbi:tyrosine-type recombinase/integrase [Streptomyces sp. NPDC057966]|uniref:tyrosine-type recombinase/integrase n=1 Tax=Streptomyces sp. NPDC057966 TaxID=3346292 RepID=UPI0036E310E7